MYQVLLQKRGRDSRHDHSSSMLLAEACMGVMGGEGTTMGQALKAAAQLQPEHSTDQVLLEFPYPRAVTTGAVTRQKGRNMFPCSLPLQVAEACSGGFSAATTCNQIQREG